ncbi:MAG: hypothetical protein U9N77_03910 [Thermodesulfobacteriota bacterium]|nr:hypothetical protein [Thermodesulfobacteriota bacterium]
MEQALSPDNTLIFFQEIKDLYKETDRLLKVQDKVGSDQCNYLELLQIV